MKRIKLLKKINDIFEYKTIDGEEKNQFVVFKKCKLSKMKGIVDKTEFEATENHIHIIDEIKENEFIFLIDFAKTIGLAVLTNLNFHYPKRKFAVFVTIKLHDSFIVRFHQIWENELPYYDVNDFKNSDERIFVFYS